MGVLPADERAVYAVTLAILATASAVAVVAAPAASGGPAPEPPPANDSAYRVTDDGTRYTIHPAELRKGCPGGTDCIPSIDDPAVQPASDAGWVRDSDLVIGVEIDGEARAYPLRVLAVHEIVNDRLAGRSIAVTYCPLCRSGLVFSRRVRGSTVEFGVSGKLHDANLVMYDRATGTYWSQVRARAVVGPLVPTELEIVPSTITTWGEWRSAHPDTEVLSRDTGIYPPSTYDGNPYAGYANRSRVGFGVDEVDPRLRAKAIVYGVAVNGTARAYPAEAVAGATVITDRVGGVPVAVVEHPADGGVRVYVRRVDGEPVRLRVEDGRLVDDRGNRYAPNGTAVAGPDAGAQMDRVATQGYYWFAWTSVHPETEVYRANVSAAVRPHPGSHSRPTPHRRSS